MMRLPVLVLMMLLPFAAHASGGGGEGGGEKSKSEVTSTIPTESPQVNQPRVFTPTETQMLLELDQQRIELERRSQALELREKLVDLMEQRLNGRVAELQQLKAELQTLLGSLSGKDAKELDQLASIYGAMKPSIAANVLNRLDNPIVLDVLTRMPSKKSGKIMEALDPAKARYLSEMMAQRTPPPIVSDTLP